MDELFDLFIADKIPGRTSIKEAYSTLRNIKLAWIVDSKGLTIQEWVNEICDTLEKDGFDLNKTRTDRVKIDFVKYDISIEPPEEYKVFAKNRELVLKNLASLRNFKAPPEMIEQTQNMLDLIDSKMKELS